MQSYSKTSCEKRAEAREKEDSDPLPQIVCVSFFAIWEPVKGYPVSDNSLRTLGDRLWEADYSHQVLWRVEARLYNTSMLFMLGLKEIIITAHWLKGVVAHY